MVRVPILLGATSVGKTELACRLCPLLEAEIVSADSRQVYRLMDIGTAKPSQELRNRIPHHLIDLVYPDEEYSAADFARDARKVIDELRERGKLPLVVGGSGLYIRALVDGLFEAPEPDRKVRNRLLEEAKDHGSRSLHRRLEKIDREAATRIHPRDLQRIVRALEVYEQTGMPISQLQRESRRMRRPVLYIGLSRGGEDLYRRIEQRVDRMIETGFADEVKSLLRAGYSPDLNSFSAVGYREMADCLRGRVAIEEAVRLTKRNTKRYAKRQLTWFQRTEGIRWIAVAEETESEDLARKTARIIEDALGY